ncbi:hypothetical protein LR48_Vigan11g041800 [Vigna angularis]|uniref:Uncharacterized protein n=1 Tax=Phaseolus angularis TaxID=3914 RepID=A0A0L9VQP5_PHAAN|nr:hypothetical protein LR48_Vigan11g041800 [Vigna angularis]
MRGPTAPTEFGDLYEADAYHLRKTPATTIAAKQGRKSNVLNIFSGDFLHFATISGNPKRETTSSLVISVKQILRSSFRDSRRRRGQRGEEESLTAFNHFLIFTGISSSDAPPSAHIHTDDHCNDRTNVQRQQTTQGRRKVLQLNLTERNTENFSLHPFMQPILISHVIQKRVSKSRDLPVSESGAVRSRMKLTTQGTFLRF